MACDGGSGPIPLADLPGRVLSAECALEVRCKQSPSQQACTESLKVRVNQIMADVDAGKVHYDGVAAGECLDLFKSLNCTYSSAITTTSDPCRKTFQGTVADDGPCFVGEECISQTCDKTSCDLTAQCCAGTCAPTVTTLATGADCSALGARCVSDSFCLRDNVAMTATCVKKIALGQPCNNSVECANGLGCLVETPGAGVGGTCAKRPARGEACSRDTFPCDAYTDTCDPTTGKCVPRAEPGAACMLETDCVLYANCDMTAMKCVALGGRGATCADNVDCLNALECVGGKCTAPAPDPVCS